MRWLWLSSLGLALSAAAPAQVPSAPAQERVTPELALRLPLGAVGRLGFPRLPEKAFCSTFTAKGTLLVGWTDGAKLRVLDTSLREPIWEVREVPLPRQERPGDTTQRMEPAAVACSKAGAIAVVSDGQPVHIMDVSTGSSTDRIHHNVRKPERISFSPDGQRFVLLSEAEAAIGKLGDLNAAFIDVPPGEVPGFVAWSEDGTEVSIFRGGGSVELFDPVHRVRTRTVAVPVNPFGLQAPTAVALSPDAAYLAVAHLTQLSTWNFKEKKWVLDTTAHSAVVEQITGSGIGDGPREIGGIISMAFVPGGPFLVTAGRHADVALWDLRSGTVVWELSAPDARGSLRRVSVSPDGRHLLGYASPFRLFVWDLESGQLVFSVPGHNGPVRALAFDGDGQRLFSAGRRQIRLWSLKTMGEIESYQAANPTSLVLSRSGEYLVGTGSHGGAVWRLGESDVLEEMPAPILHSSRGALAATQSGPTSFLFVDNYRLQFYDAQKGEVTKSIPLATHERRSLSISPDRRLAVVQGYGREAELLSLETGASLRHSGRTYGAQFSPVENRIATVAEDKIWLTEADTGLARFSMPVPREVDTVRLAFSKDGRILAAVPAPTAFHLFEVATGRELLKHDTGQEITAIAFSPSSPLLATGHRDGAILLWDVARPFSEARPLSEASSFETPIALWSRAFHHSKLLVSDGRFVRALAWWTGKSLELTRIEDGKNIATLPIAERSKQLWISPNSKTLAVVSGKEVMKPHVHLWDLSERTEIASFPTHEESAFRELIFAMDGKTVFTVSGSARRSWELSQWEVATGKKVRDFYSDRPYINGVALSPNGSLLAAGADGQGVLVWEVKTGNRLHTLTRQNAQADRYGLSVWFSENGKRLHETDLNGAVETWDVPTGTPLGGVRRPPMLSPGGRYRWERVQQSRSAFVIHQREGGERSVVLPAALKGFTNGDRFAVTPGRIWNLEKMFRAWEH